MEETTGLISAEVIFVKTEPELIKSICKRIRKDEAYIKKLMRYNMWTVKQFAELSQKDISTIANLCRPMNEKGTLVYRLNYCYPFPDAEGVGPKFVYRNEKSEAYLRK